MSLGLFRKGKTDIIANFHRNDLVISSPEHKVLMVSYCDQSMSVVRLALCVVRRQQFVLKANSSYTQCDSNFIGMLPRWLPTKIAKIVLLR